MTYLATARVGPQDEGRVQSAVARAFPNVTAIPVREVLARVAGVVDQIASALGLVAGFSVATGLVVMAGALGVTRSRRLYESVLLRTLGATRGAVTRIFAVEYALLGGAAGLAGTALAAALAWAVLRFALDARWTWQPGTLALGVASAVGLALAVGCLATRRLLGQEPLRVLRER
jgi:putative ABC transport system permease protein